jgi:hypothetical protein
MATGASRPATPVERDRSTRIRVGARGTRGPAVAGFDDRPRHRVFRRVSTVRTRPDRIRGVRRENDPTVPGPERTTAPGTTHARVLAASRPSAPIGNVSNDADPSGARSTDRIGPRRTVPREDTPGDGWEALRRRPGLWSVRPVPWTRPKLARIDSNKWANYSNRHERVRAEGRPKTFNEPQVPRACPTAPSATGRSSRRSESWVDESESDSRRCPPTRSLPNRTVGSVERHRTVGGHHNRGCVY